MKGAGLVPAAGAAPDPYRALWRRRSLQAPTPAWSRTACWPLASEEALTFHARGMEGLSPEQAKQI